MSDEHFKVLLIEDDPEAARLVRQMLAYARGASFDLECVDQLSAAFEHLGSGGFDVVLLDLDLRNSQGHDALARIFAQAPNVPVIVLTGIEDDTAGLEALRAGAHDYVVKGWTDGNVLSRSVRYAIERQRLTGELAQVRREEQQERELRSLERLSVPLAAVTSGMYGCVPIRKSLPTVFEELCRRYEQLLELALEQQAFRVEHNISESLRSMAGKLGVLRASPRDLVEIHSAALKAKSAGAGPQRAEAYLAEGRVMVLELMGHLASHYRSYAAGFSAAADRRLAAESPTQERGNSNDQV